MAETLTHLELPPNTLKKLSSGKVRDLFELSSSTLLFVATDRISAYDVILSNGIPSKGALLTTLSAHWLTLINTLLPSLRTHFLSLALPASLPPSLQSQLARRSMQVRRIKPLPLESIVRGYLAGSAWNEYLRSGTVHGAAMPAGLRESERLPAPMWTPSTKADAGAHDENISVARAEEIVGKAVAGEVARVSLEIYEMAREYAEERGIIIADTKFEFGLDEESGEVVLIDEVLTPDSSRFWPVDGYEVGRAQDSYDKQYLRDWLTSSGLRGKPDVVMPEEVVAETGRKYREAFERLTGRRWADE